MTPSHPSTGTKPGGPKTRAAGSVPPFGVNEMRLNGKQWLAAAAIMLLIGWLMPRVWERIEHFETGPDYRIPYSLSKDYWLYARRLRQEGGSGKVILLGDSVVWGEYVLSDGAWSHFLNQEAGATNRFVNAGMNGLFPLALEGLIRNYGQALHRQKVLLHCNLLWMTSPKVDLSAEKEEPFNHSRLVPQFFPRIPSYRADANERLNAIVERNVTFLGWVNHVQDASFGQKSILKWTLEEDGAEPPHFPNAYRNPLAQITLSVPSAPHADPERGPASPRHKPWSEQGVGTTRFEWVALDSSLQWRAFQRLVTLLRKRDNDVLVVLGPFNEHIMAGENRPAYQKLHDGIATWLAQNRIPTVLPEALPSPLYADASHPLTQGYELLAKTMFSDVTFQQWLNMPRSPRGSAEN